MEPRQVIDPGVFQEPLPLTLVSPLTTIPSRHIHRPPSRQSLRLHEDVKTHLEVTIKKLPFSKTTLDGDVCLWVPVKDLGRDRSGYAEAGGWNKGEVLYDPRSPRRSLRTLAMHEQMHEIWNHTPLTTIPLKDEEFIVNELAVWLVVALEENPRFTDFVAGR